MASSEHELARSFEVFSYLKQFPDDAQDFIRLQMRFALKRDRIVTEMQMRALVVDKAREFQRKAGVDHDTPDAWAYRLREAKKQLTDLYFAANYSLDYLKYIVAENAQDIESGFNVHIPEPLDFSLNLEEADINILIKKMYFYESLSAEEKVRRTHEIQELRIVLIQRLISEQPEFVRVAHKCLSIADLHGIYDRIVGSGRVGGKSAGMLLAYRILVTPEPDDPYDFAHYFKIPNSYYVGDEVFHSFLDYNNLLHVRNQKFKDVEAIEQEYPGIRQQILAGRFQAAIWERLRLKVDALKGKAIIVRSSSLLEDNFGLSFAGKYDSFFLANQGTSEENLAALGRAIKAIYAGVFSPNAMAYRRRNEILYRYESMAILIQEVEGQRFGRYFMPDFAGVLFSENPYCWSRRIRKEDGLLRLVHGLGTRAVDRVGEDYPRMVALGHPTLRPDKGAADKYSQRFVDVVDLETCEQITVSLQQLVGEGIKGCQSYILSVRKEDRIQEAFTSIDLMDGKPVVTFDRLLGRTSFAKVLRAALEKLRRHYGIELDTELAGSLDGKGDFTITLLQCRPQSLRVEHAPPVLPEVAADNVVFSCLQEVPSGRIDNVSHLVYVDPEAYARLNRPSDRYEVARILGRVNQQLEKECAIVIGPGRWGSNNILLGVPVQYYEINNFKMLGEVARSSNGVVPEVSYGTHFFQDLVETGIFCVPIYPDAAGVRFNEGLLRGTTNLLARFVPPEAAECFDQVIRVLEPPAGKRFHVCLNARDERGLCYVGPPIDPVATA